MKLDALGNPLTVGKYYALIDWGSHGQSLTTVGKLTKFNSKGSAVLQGILNIEFDPDNSEKFLSEVVFDFTTKFTARLIPVDENLLLAIQL